MTKRQVPILGAYDHEFLEKVKKVILDLTCTPVAFTRQEHYLKMAGTKRHAALTTDDLMHMQEGPVQKRLRTEPAHHPDDVDSDVSQSDGEDSSVESSDIEDGDVDDAEDDPSQPEDNEPRDHIEDTNWDSGRFPSRMSSIKPRSSITATTNSPLNVAAAPATFTSLNISPPLLSALSKLSIRKPTEVQVACIPPLLQGECAQNNTMSGIRN